MLNNQDTQDTQSLSTADTITFSIIDKKTGEPVSYSANAELVREYYNQAAYQLQIVAKANEAFKAEVEAIAETTGAPKAFWSAFFKARYKESLKDISGKADAFQSVNEAFE